jgi:cell division septum initiation protein DivIVA
MEDEFKGKTDKLYDEITNLNDRNEKLEKELKTLQAQHDSSNAAHSNELKAAQAKEKNLNAELNALKDIKQ